MKTTESDPSRSTGKPFHRSPHALRAILDASPEATLVMDSDGKLLFANASAHRLWGVEGSTLMGQPIKRLFPPQFEFLQTQQAMSPEGITTRADALHSEGHLFPVSVTIVRAEIEEKQCRIISVRENRQLHDDHADREELFESLERFAAGLAHEFNNVLTGVLGNLHLAMEERGRMQPALLEAAYHASLRAREITRDLIDFGKGDRPRQRSLALQEMLRENSLIALSGSHTRCDFQFDKDLTPAYMDPSQIGQVLHHLLSFADEAIGHSGTVHISARNHTVNSEAATMDGVLMMGDYVMVTMEMGDTRIGADDVEHLFEPYARTGGRVRGLSLAICHSIAHRHGGLLAASCPESGRLRVDLYLPASMESPVEDFGADFPEGMPDIACANVLIVDDEQLVRLVLQRTLENMGHRCSAVNDGEEGIDAYQKALERGDRYDLVFMDLKLHKEMDGKEACRQLLEIDPLAACVVISGDTNDDAMKNPSSYGFIAHLAKPFDLDELSDTVEELLSRNEQQQSIFYGSETGDPEDEEDDDGPVALTRDNIVEIDFSQPPPRFPGA